jgi:hypothetical protein
MSPPHSLRATLSTLILLLLALTTQPLTAIAQVIDPSQVPACALQCSSIIAAQNLCAPPVTPAPDVTCFCNSNYLVPFKSGQTTGVCDVICQPNELQALYQYYQGLCGSQPAATATTTRPGVAQTTVTVPASTSTAATSGSSQGKTNNKKHKSWYVCLFASPKPTITNPLDRISDHYGWVIMIIVLVLAAIAGTIFGIWFKRRRSRHPTTNRDSVLGTRDASHVLRDPHAIPGSSPPSTSQHTMMGTMPPSDFYASAGSLRSGNSVPRTHTMRSMGAGMRAPSSSASDLKGKARVDGGDITELGKPFPARRSSSKLQRKGSSGTTPIPNLPT